MYNYSAFIYAKDAVNIALTGQGTLDGQAGDGTPWCWMSRDYMTDYQDDDRTALINMNNNRVPVEERIFGQGHFLRPNFIQVIGCENVLVEGITLVRSPMWEVNPVLCTNVTVRAVSYTHLDVYKRQPLRHVRVWLPGKAAGRAAV